MEDKFEDIELRLTATPKQEIPWADWAQVKAKFIKVKDGADQDPIDGQMHVNKLRSVAFRFEKVPDDKDHYDLRSRVEYTDPQNREFKVQGEAEYRIWPKKLDIKFMKKAEDADVGFEAVPFKLYRGAALLSQDILTTAADGTHPHTFAAPGASKLLVQPPYAVEQWTKGAEDSGRQRHAKVKHEFKSAFHRPVQQDEIKQSEPPSVERFLAYLRLSGWDANVLLSWFPRIIEQLDTVPRAVADELNWALRNVWDHYFPLGEPLDVPFALGAMMSQLRYYPEALKFYEHSLRIYGPHATTLYNIGVCNYHLRQLDTALERVEEALKLHPQDEPGRALRLHLKREIARRSG